MPFCINKRRSFKITRKYPNDQSDRKKYQCCSKPFIAFTGQLYSPRNWFPFEQLFPTIAKERAIKEILFKATLKYLTSIQTIKHDVFVIF